MRERAEEFRSSCGFLCKLEKFFILCILLLLCLVTLPCAIACMFFWVFIFTWIAGEPRKTDRAGFFVPIFPFPFLAMSVMVLTILYVLWRSKPPKVIKVTAFLTVTNFLCDLIYLLSQKFNRVVVFLLMFAIVVYGARVLMAVSELERHAWPPRFFSYSHLRREYFISGLPTRHERASAWSRLYYVWWAIRFPLVFIGCCITLMVLVLVDLLFLLCMALAALFLFQSRLFTVRSVSRAWYRWWNPTRHQYTPYNEVATTNGVVGVGIGHYILNSTQYYRTVKLQLLYQNIPQLALQISNNTLMHAWTPVAAVALCVSLAAALDNIQVLWRRHRALSEAAGPGGRSLPSRSLSASNINGRGLAANLRRSSPLAAHRALGASVASYSGNGGATSTYAHMFPVRSLCWQAVPFTSDETIADFVNDNKA